MKNLPKIPSNKSITHKVYCAQQPVPYFTAQTNIQQNVIVGIPLGFVVIGVKIILLTEFVVPESTSFTVSVGLSDEVYRTFYANSYELTTVGTPESLEVTHANFSGPGSAPIEGAHNVVAYFMANGPSYLSEITQGSLEISVLYRLM